MISARNLPFGLIPATSQVEGVWRRPLAKFWDSIRHLGARAEFGDLLLYLYLVSITRQCFWVVPNNRLAWVLTLALAAFVWVGYVATNEALNERAGKQFWLVVGLSLLSVYALRFVFADVSFDVLNHHLFLSERSLRGPLLLAADFFPTPAPYNPAPDTLTGIFRHYLGYRLGTIVNLLALLWAARVIDKLLRPYVRNHWWRATAVLVCVFAEHLLFEINNYMVDLIALPLTLEATRLTIIVDSWPHFRRRVVRIAFLCGLAVTMKLTNAAMVVPVIVTCVLLTIFKFRPRLTSLASTIFFTLVAFFAPLLPYSTYIYRETRSPFFPIYNGIFKSPYWPISNVWDPRWGPRGAWEIVMWPLLLRLRPERLSELGVYSGRITIAVIAILLFLVLWWRRAGLQTSALCLIVLLTALLWSMSTGYIRYALHLESLSGSLIIIVVIELRKGAWLKQHSVRLALSTILLVGLIAQTILAGVYVSNHEWSMRATIFDDPHSYRLSIPYLMHDHSIQRFLTPREWQMYQDVEVWAVSGTKSIGPEVLLNARVPFIGLVTHEYFTTYAGAVKFELALDAAEGKKVRSLCSVEDFEEARNNLHSLGLETEDVIPVEIPFFSPDHRIPMLFFAVKRGRLETGAAAPAPAVYKGLPDASYSAAIVAIETPDTFKPGEKRKVIFKVRNTGSGDWPSQNINGSMNFVTAGNRWLSANGTTVVNDMDTRTTLPHDLKPNEEIELVLTVTAPQIPGEYLLEVDMVHEGVTWFYQRGSQTLRWRTRVVKDTPSER